MGEELIKVDQFKELISAAPQVLEENRTSCLKAIAKANELSKLASEKMDDVIDLQLSEYIDRAKKTVIIMTDRRKPFTQIMTAIAKEFTSLESEIKPSIDLCQKFRDDYATTKMNERRERERLAQLKLEKENEAIDLILNFKVSYSQKYSDFLLKIKTDLTDWFNLLTLESVKTAEQEIGKFGNGLPESTFNFKVPVPVMKRHTSDEYYDIIQSTSMALSTSGPIVFRKDMESFKRELVDMIPSKAKQLDEIEIQRLEMVRQQKIEAERQRIVRIQSAWDKRKSDREQDVLKKAEIEAENERKRIQADKDLIAAQQAEVDRRLKADQDAELESLRQQEEKEKLEKESEDQRIKSEAEAQVAASGEKATILVDTQANLFAEAPKVKEGYKITILNHAGYLLMTQFWFENEGKNLSVDKFEAMTFARIKAFCEKYAAKNEEFIESKLIKYEPIYKAR